MVSLDSVGTYEVRMFDEPESSLNDAPVFWLELFDHIKQSSIDSCRCDGIEPAMAALKDFASRAGCSDENCPRNRRETSG
jgi:hypothetical protein